MTMVGEYSRWILHANNEGAFKKKKKSTQEWISSDSQRQGDLIIRVRRPFYWNKRFN